MLNELQSSYDELLHKYAAAENALDKVSRSLALPFKCIITAARKKTTFHQNHFIGAIWGSAAPWLWRSRRGFSDGEQGGFGKILVFPLQSIAAIGGGQDCIDGGGGEEEE